MEYLQQGIGWQALGQKDPLVEYQYQAAMMFAEIGSNTAAHGPRELQRLAGKQAELRNKAESINAQMQVLNYHHTDMEQLIELMEEIERDLLAGRYQNALRKREVVLQGLRTQKEYVGGEFEVKQDATLNIPKDVQKEILEVFKNRPRPGGRKLSADTTDN